MKQFYKIDDEGYYIEPVILRPIIEVDKDLIIYFPEEFALHILGLLEVPEIDDAFLEEYMIPKMNGKTPMEFMIETPFTDGMYKPRWTGTEWVDEITQEELDEMRSQVPEAPKITLETLYEKLEVQERDSQMLAQQIVDLELQQLLGGV